MLTPAGASSSSMKSTNLSSTAGEGASMHRPRKGYGSGSTALKADSGRISRIIKMIVCRRGEFFILLFFININKILILVEAKGLQLSEIAESRFQVMRFGENGFSDQSHEGGKSSFLIPVLFHILCYIKYVT